MVGILSSGHQLLLCVEVENFLVEKYTPIFRKILLPICAVDVRSKAANLHVRVCYRSVIRHCVMSRHSLFCDITRYLVTGTAVRNIQQHADLLSHQSERDSSSEFS